MKAFAQAERFVSEVSGKKLRPAYVFVGDEGFFRKQFREAILEHLVPSDLRDFSLFDFDLADTDLAEILDRARTPSLMAPFQVFFVRGVKTLFGRGSNDDKLGAIEDYCKNPNPDALLIFVADHISIPADARRMDMTDKERYERIREKMGSFCKSRARSYEFPESCVRAAAASAAPPRKYGLRVGVCRMGSHTGDSNSGIGFA